MINIFFAILPGIIFFLLSFYFDKDFIVKRWKVLIIVFILGAIGSYICYRLEMHYGSYFKRVKDSTYLEVLFYAIFGVAIFEEGYKWLITFVSTLFDKGIKLFSIITYAVFASNGFALFENIVFFALKYKSSMISRMFTAYPSHICNAIWMGYFLILFKKSKGLKKYIFLLLSVFFPILIHALYNSFLYGRNPTLMSYHIYYYLGLVIITIVLFIRIRKNAIISE